MIKFTIYGKPVPKPRMTRQDSWPNPPKKYRNKAWPRPCVARYRVYAADIKEAYISQGLPKFKGNVAMGFKFYTSGRGDLDNFIKAAKDSLNGYGYFDDKQVKKYFNDPEIIPCKKGEERTEIEIKDFALPGHNGLQVQENRREL